MKKYIAATIILAITTSTEAGSVKTVGDWESKCTYEYSGVVSAGDAEKIRQLETFGSAGATLCLNSPGGSMSEGLKIFDVIWNKQMRTRVVNGASCESACAIAWLGGSEQHGTLAINALSRHIEATATLGFHAPQLGLPDDAVYPAKDVEKAFLIALSVAEGVFQLNLLDEDAADPLNNYLFGRILATPGSQMHRISSIGEALMSNVSVAQLPFPEKITKADMINLCENAYLVNRGVNSAMGGVNTYVTKQRERASEGERVKLINDEYWAVRLDGARRRQYGCKLGDQALADFIKGRSGNALWVTLFYVDVWPGEPAERVWEELADGRETDSPDIEMPFYALYEANTPLRQLAD